LRFYRLTKVEEKERRDDIIRKRQKNAKQLRGEKAISNISSGELEAANNDSD